MNADIDLTFVRLSNHARLPIVRGEEHACPYLPGRTAAEGLALLADFDGDDYQALMDSGFRRSGTFVYRTMCRGCQACVPIRVPVQRFVPSRSQRRVLRRNQDLKIRRRRARSDDQRWQLFRRYQQYQHDGTMCAGRDEFEHFLYVSPFTLLEISYWIGRRLVGVGICDVCPRSLSSVYFFFEPEEAERSLGIFSALIEIDECRHRGLEHWYSGYYVSGCSKMAYKAQFRPSEYLHADGVWRAEPTSAGPAIRG